MVDHIDEQAEGSGNQSLDQKAIDEALAAMQIADSGESAAEIEPAVHSNGGETFGDSENDGHEDLDAAIAALQADATSPVETAWDGAAESDEASQEDIDSAIAAMSTGGSSSEFGEEAVDDDVQGEDIAESRVGAAGGENISAAIVQMQQEGPGGGGADALPTAEAETSLFSSQTRPAAASDTDSTFSGLDEDDLTRDPPPQEPPVAAALTDPDAIAGDHDDLSTPENEGPEPAAAAAGEGWGAAEPISAGKAGLPAREAVESLPKFSPQASGSETSVAGRKKLRLAKLRLGIALIGLIAVAGSAAYFGPDVYSARVANTQERPAEALPAEPAAAAPPPPSSPTPATETPYGEKLKEVARLRADLLSKSDEIDRLRQFYRDGISELEEEIQQEATKHGVREFSQAAAHHRIRLDLESIRRRRAYIDELAKPYHWLQEGSEELLFLSRRTEIDLQMSELAAGIELTKHMRRLNASLQKYQLSPERLSIDVSNSSLQPLEETWQAVGMQNRVAAQKAVANGDPAIIEEICSGDTGRIAELTTLTIKASKCLSQLDTSELFLNRLTFLSPVAAKYLSNWRGQWLCLNGFQEMTPEVARYLFQWEGKWISLNGLTDFSPGLGELLLSWEGDQLELMGLAYSADQPETIGLQQLVDWEKSGGRLFVPEPVRAEMEKLE